MAQGKSCLYLIKAGDNQICKTDVQEGTQKGIKAREHLSSWTGQKEFKEC